MHGLNVLVFDGGRETAAIFAKLNEALIILRDVDPRRLSRIASDISRILVVDAPSPSYYALSNSCVLSRAGALNGAAVRIALTIVHEATHARLFGAGIRYRRSLRERVERRCVHEEIAFLESLKMKGYQGTDAWALYLQERLSRPWWTDDALFRSKHDFLTRQSAPRWLLRLHALIFRPTNTDGGKESKN
jgi:hypothetical protein